VTYANLIHPYGIITCRVLHVGDEGIGLLLEFVHFFVIAREGLCDRLDDGGNWLRGVVST
jgi:hypothetical protein